MSDVIELFILVVKIYLIVVGCSIHLWHALEFAYERALAHGDIPGEYGNMGIRLTAVRAHSSSVYTYNMCKKHCARAGRVYG